MLTKANVITALTLISLYVINKFNLIKIRSYHYVHKINSTYSISVPAAAAACSTFIVPR